MLINNFYYFNYIRQQISTHGQFNSQSKRDRHKSRSHRPRPRKLTKNLNVLLTRARRKLFAFLEFLNIIIARYWILTLAPLAPGPRMHQREHQNTELCPCTDFAATVVQQLRMVIFFKDKNYRTWRDTYVVLDYLTVAHRKQLQIAINVRLISKPSMLTAWDVDLLLTNSVDLRYTLPAVPYKCAPEPSMIYIWHWTN